MIRLNFFIRKKDEVSENEFKEYMLEKHSELIVKYSKKLRIRKYIQVHILKDDPYGKMMCQAYGAKEDPYHCVEEFYFKSRQEILEVFNNNETQDVLREIIEDKRKISDFSKSLFYFCIELPQINPIAKVTAKEENTNLKGYYVGHKKEELSIEDTQFHWLTCHGYLSREYSEVAYFLKYIQVHKIAFSIEDKLKELTGEMENFTPIGNAEVWFDKRSISSAPQVEEQTALKLFAQDIYTFADVPKSPLFVGKEHIFIDKQVMTEPLPTPAPKIL